MTIVIAILGVLVAVIMLVTLWPLVFSLALSFLAYAIFGYGLGWWGFATFLWGAAFVICFSAMETHI